MKPEPDPQSDGKHAKPRRSFTKDNRVEDALEKDLWDLDEPAPDAAAEEEEAAPEPGKNQEGRTILPITPRSTRRDLVFKQSPPKKKPLATPDESEGAGAAEEETKGAPPTSAAPDEAFGDLDDSPDGDAESGKEVTRMDEEDTEDPSAPEEAAGSSAPAEPVSTAVKELTKGLSKVERLGLVGFLALVVGGLLFFLAYSVNKIPENQKPLTPGDLPIPGKIISADKISSYWREPDISGGETVRRGTLLLPVVELGVSGGPGAVRVLFRDSDGAIVGDGVTRPVRGDGTVTIAATAGFDDQGMFAAYRTGETKPWKIEVFEGTSESAPGSDFKKLFEIPISTQRR
ncbi:hypothetical protein OVA24_04850 [Luteolibacter sp. SL250]|uniref:hypothetical protein n=1 Tax=Luteolibacter sp. SL250 TaxID=2995170 RepID=UPI00226ED83D|nr:hypothetical protein [Luteolibacter sp. SL250]WAC20708.1 hypothetical protein OVA24_04850 [Luteolibacter sp. SL250]